MEGSPNAFGLRPSVENNKSNYVAFLAMCGIGPRQVLTLNTASNGNHVAVVSHRGEGPEGIVTLNDRQLPVDGQDPAKRTADALIVTNPDVQMAVVGANADIPIVVGTSGDALIAVNGGWQNLASGVDLALRGQLASADLLGTEGPVNFAVGPGARRDFAVRLARLVEASQGRAILGGDAEAYWDAVDLEYNPDHEKVDLELAHWAQNLMGALALRGGIVGVDVCTITGGRAGYLHSSRVERVPGSRPEPGQMADGDRGMTALIPRGIQAPYAQTR